MARIRSIKPDFWTDESLSECSVSARLMFIGTWNFADDNGNLPRSAKKLKMQIFPADSIDCEVLIQELITHGLLTEYSVNGEKFLHINGFRKHQIINRPSKSVIPQPSLTEDSLSDQGSLTDDSLTDVDVDVDVDVEGKKLVCAAEKPAARKKGCRIPDDWLMTDELEAIGMEVREAAGLPKIDLCLEASKFRDFWRAKSGKDGIKMDWEATWRNWCRNANGPRGSQQQLSEISALMTRAC